MKHLHGFHAALPIGSLGGLPFFSEINHCCSTSIGTYWAHSHLQWVYIWSRRWSTRSFFVGFARVATCQVANVSFRLGTSHSKPEVGVATALDFQLGLDGVVPVVGLVGGIFSSIAMPIASISAVTQVPQIGLGSSPLLSNKDLFPYYLRTFPPDTFQGKAFWSWVLKYDIPLAVCIYSEEAYGMGLFQAMKDEARLAGEENRIGGVALRDMPENFVRDEALKAIDVARSFGSRFLFLSANVGGTTNLLPVLEEAGMLGSNWQVLASETALSFERFPVGFMRWKPVSRGLRFEAFRSHWARMRADDVVSAQSRGRYKIDKFRISLDEAVVPPIADAIFSDADASLDVYSTFYFDACYAYALAVNELLNKGTPLAEIKGKKLLDQLLVTEFEGTSGFVSFDGNGDRRAAAFELENMQPDGWKLAGIFSTSSNQLTVERGPYWMDGSRTGVPPPALMSCPAGYQEESRRCEPCPRGFQCPNGLPELCHKGHFSNVTGSASCSPCDKGSFSADLGATQCTKCVPGFFANRSGMELCERCPKGSYTPFSQSESCIACKFGQVTEESGAQSFSECRCGAGYFICNTSVRPVGCVPCPEGLLCEGLGLPVHQPGFWASDVSSCNFRVLRCRDELQCPGGRPLGECADGRQGLACNNCKANYFPQDSGTCAECTSVDLLPAILGGCIVLSLFLLFVRLLHGYVDQLSLNTLTVAAVGGQLVTAVQALTSIQHLRVEWVQPVQRLIRLSKLVAFDLDVVKISCIYGEDSPTLKLVGKLSIFPLFVGLLGIAWCFRKLQGRRQPAMLNDDTFNLCGTLVFALFISVTLALLDPFQCVANPDGSSSMLSNPGILCFNSGEHTILLLLSSLGILAYPVSILAWTTYTILMYPSRVKSGVGLQLVYRHHFVFQRFRPERYYYGLLLLIRNALLAVLPVMLTTVPEVQGEIMGALLLTSAAVQARLWPWRADVANYTDLMITSLLQILLLGISPLIHRDRARSIQMLGWLLAFAVLSPFLCGLIVLSYALWGYVRPPIPFGIFLCYDKGSAGSLCRLLKLLISAHSDAGIFLDVDQLDDLDSIFDVIRVKTKSVVVVLTPDFLKQLWCAGEVVTALKNRVRIVPVKCDDYVPPTDEMLQKLGDHWTPEQKQILAFHGIGLRDVQRAQGWLHQLPSLHLSRYGSQEQLEAVVLEMLQLSQVSTKLFGPSSEGERGGYRKARILITGLVTDAEALATLKVFQILVLRHMRKECVVVHSYRELMAYRPWSYYLVVLLAKGLLRDPSFAKILLSLYLETEEKMDRQLEIITVNADENFEFPSVEFLNELENGLGRELGIGLELGVYLSAAYRSLLNVLALPLSPLGSERLLEQQVLEICRRFRRYKNLVFSLALDDQDDLQVEGDGVSPQELASRLADIGGDSMDIFTSSQVKKQFFSTMRQLTWTEAGNVVFEGNEVALESNLFGRLVSDEGERSSSGEGDFHEGHWSPDWPKSKLQLAIREELEGSMADAWNPDWPIERVRKI
ncbi:unnamed protein product [Durusdinium trenchii]|uniref:Uncharacterized protein n=1 Tax=Durusdinium trenchii TaxID=1381693 RepID=A0ABP0N6H5_9DINO